MIMENYEFVETTSRSVEENGEKLRVVNFRGTDTSDKNHERLNVDGSFTMQPMDYFKAGMEGRISEVIRDMVVARLTPTDHTQEEPSQ